MNIEITTTLRSSPLRVLPRGSWQGMSWVLLLGALSMACAGQKIEPQVASSANQANYGAGSPATLQSVSNDYVNGEGEVRKNTTDFAKSPEQLKDPPWPVVQGVVTRADEAG